MNHAARRRDHLYRREDAPLALGGDAFSMYFTNQQKESDCSRLWLSLEPANLHASGTQYQYALRARNA